MVHWRRTRRGGATTSRSRSDQRLGYIDAVDPFIRAGDSHGVVSTGSKEKAHADEDQKSAPDLHADRRVPHVLKTRDRAQGCQRVTRIAHSAQATKYPIYFLVRFFAVVLRELVFFADVFGWRRSGSTF